MRQNRFLYRLAAAISGVASRLIFRCKIVRNEIRGKKGPFVIIANHESALDFINLIGASHEMMTCVISNSIYRTLPIKGYLSRIGVIPKQQFQTHIDDIRKMKSVISNGGILVIYPAGLMTENGLSTPIPDATYRFLQWLGTDIYVARVIGTYFVMPKWGRGLRPGRTRLDIHRLFTKEELADLPLTAVRERTDRALLFDAYREQELYKEKYWHGDHIAGLENVLYVCPHCHRELTMHVYSENIIACSECGYAEKSDRSGFLRRVSDFGPEYRYASDWSRWIYSELRAKIERGVEDVIATDVRVQMIDEATNKFRDVGVGSITLSAYGFHFVGTIREQEVDTVIGISNFASLPFTPGRCLEIQHGDDIYRCFPTDGRLTMKIINIVKIYYEREVEAHRKKEQLKEPGRHIG